uniref:Uncharacterized protein n=1 Tax=Pseudonaja textilis TaxID=8673 RepID=A0A670YY05_PSETE
MFPSWVIKRLQENLSLRENQGPHSPPSLTLAFFIFPPPSLPWTEYAAINHMLDQINSCLDHLEEKNDHLNTQLKELLESNRQTRLEFQQQQQQLGQDGEPRKAQPDS